MAKNQKNKSRPSTGRQEMVTRQSEDGSFEIIVDDNRQASSATTGGSASGRKGAGAGKMKIALLGGLAVLLIVAGGVYALSGDDDSPEFDELVFDAAPSFQTYGGGSATNEEVSLGSLPSRGESMREVRDPDEEAQRAEEVAYRREDDWVIGEHDVVGLEPDGEEILEDSRGHPVSRRESEMRMEGQLERIESSELQFERRLRQRDAVLNSRILEPHEGGARVATGVQLSEEVQRRVEENFRPRLQPDQEYNVEDHRFDDDEYYE